MTAMLRLLSQREAERLTDQIKFTIESIDNGLFKLRNLLEEAQSSNVWQMLGFSSWTAYLSSLFEGRPMRLPREERQQLVGYLSGEGMSTRAIAPIVGVHHDTVAQDVKVATPVGNPTPEPIADTATGEIIDAEVVREVLGDPAADAYERVNWDIQPPSVKPVEEPRPVVGMDGKTYKRPEPKAPKPVPSGDAAELLNAETVSKDIGRALMSLSGMQYPEHRERVITRWWPLGSEAGVA